MNWIERGNMDEIIDVHDMDRPRGLAAIIMLAELTAAFWFSAVVIQTAPGGMSSHGSAHLMSVTPVLLWPSSPPEQADSELFLQTDENDEQANDNAGAATEPTGAKGTGSEATGTAAPDDIRIVSISPSSTVPLWVGDIVNFEVTAEYNLTSAHAGVVGLVIEECNCDDPGLLPGSLSKLTADAHRFRVRSDTGVDGGRRTQVLSKRIRVPVAKVLDVSVHLTGENATTGTEDGRTFRIVDGGKPATGTQSSIKITSILPTQGTILKAGENVDFEIVADYILTNETGVLRLAIDDSASHRIAEFSEDIKRGQRRLVFRERIRLPADTTGDSVRVTLALDQIERPSNVTYKLSGSSR